MAPPSSDFEIRDRAELIDAAQVVHVVLLDFLYAAFSCHHPQDPEHRRAP